MSAAFRIGKMNEKWKKKIFEKSKINMSAVFTNL